METTQKKLFAFVDTHIKDLKRLLFETDMALMSMVLLKLNKKMDTSEAKIKSTQAKIPFGLYTSPGETNAYIFLRTEKLKTKYPNQNIMNKSRSRYF